MQFTMNLARINLKFL